MFVFGSFTHSETAPHPDFTLGFFSYRIKTPTKNKIIPITISAIPTLFWSLCVDIKTDPINTRNIAKRITVNHFLILAGYLDELIHP